MSVSSDEIAAQGDEDHGVRDVEEGAGSGHDALMLAPAAGPDM